MLARGVLPYTCLFVYPMATNMKKFKHWLNKNPGMATTLSQKLGVTPATISNAKHGRRPIPVGWFNTIVKLSKGTITLAELVDARTQETS